MRLGVLVALLLSLGASASGEGTIVYHQNDSLYSVRPDGTGRSLLLRVPGSSSAFALSRDGRWVAYVAQRSPPDGSFDLHVRRLGGGGHRQLTDDEVHEFAPDWSRDGRRVLYSALGRLGGLYVVNLDGGRRRISRRGGIYEAPAWSPDGRSIVFSWRRCETCVVSTVRMVDADGGRERVLARAERTTESAAPQWSPDGTRIVDSWSGRLWTMRPDGSDRRRLTRPPGVDWAPAWSPDGQQIAFMHAEGANRRTVVAAIDADGSRRRTLRRTGTRIRGLSAGVARWR